MDGSHIMSLKSKLGLNYGKCPALVQQTIQSLYNHFQGIIEVLKHQATIWTHPAQ